MQKASSHTYVLLHIVGMRLQVYFTPLTEVLFTFPSRYLFTIGCWSVFSLIQWSGQIRTEFHLHRATWDTFRRATLIECGYHALWHQFPMVFNSLRLSKQGPSTPIRQVYWVWASPLSLATTCGITSFSFPRVTEMFHFTP